MDPTVPGRVVAEEGPFDVVVNNAALFIHQPLSEVTLDDFERQVAINFRATFLFCQAAAPLMAERGWGRIVNVSSIGARTGGYSQSAVYSGTKAAIIAITKNFARNYGASGVTANAIAPGAVDSFMTQHIIPEYRERYIAEIPAGRFSQPPEIAIGRRLPRVGRCELRQRCRHRRQRRVAHAVIGARADRGRPARDAPDARGHRRRGVGDRGAPARVRLARRRRAAHRLPSGPLAARGGADALRLPARDDRLARGHRGAGRTSSCSRVRSRMRAEQARAALDAGAHVLAEKPFTVSAADAWDLDARARAAGRVLMLCYAWNEMGIVEAARRLLVDDGGVGRIEHVSLAMSTVVRDLLTRGRTYIELPIDSLPRTETWSDPSSVRRWVRPGPAHPWSRPPLPAPARPRDGGLGADRPGRRGVELHDAITLRFADGAIGTVSGAALPWGSFGNTHQLQVRVTGERGQVLLDLDRPLVRRSRGEQDDVTVDLSDDDITWSFGRVVDRFVDLAAGRTTEIRSPAELGARVVEVLEATYRSAASGRWEPTADGLSR